MPDLTTENQTELDGDVRAAAKEVHTALETDRPLDGTKISRGKLNFLFAD